MSDNPFQSPLADSVAVGVLSGRREDLRKVAVYQKGIQFCILIYVIAIFSQFLVPPEVRILPLLGGLLAGIAGLVFVILLSMQVYHPVVGVLFGVLTLVPCLGLLVLLLINERATSLLKRNGFRVGLMGARLSDFSQPPGTP